MQGNSKSKSLVKINPKIWLIQFILACFLLVGLQIYKPIQFNTDLSRLFNTMQPDKMAQLALDRFSAQVENQNILLIGHPNLTNAIADTANIANQLKQNSQLQQVQTQFNFIPEINSIVGFYQDYRHFLLSDDYRDILFKTLDNAQDNNAAQTSPNNALFEKQFALLNQLANPFVVSSLQIDPSLSLADYLANLPLPEQKFNQYQDYLYFEYQQNFYVLLRFSTKTSGLSLNDSHQLVSQINQLTAQLESDVLTSGQVFFADFASQSAQREMWLFSTLSVVGLILLIILAYRNLVSLISTLSLVGISLFYGYLGLNLCFTQVHILTFVFAVMLVGIAADYSFHALTELATQKGHLSKIKLPLVMGFISTAVGYLVLMFAPFAIFAQVGVFILAGLSGALISVLVLYPSLAVRFKLADRRNTLTRLSALNRLQLGYCQTGGFLIVCMLAVAASFYLAFSAQFNDDVRRFYKVSPELAESQQSIQNIIGLTDDFQFVLVRGDSPQTVMQDERQAVLSLTQLKADNVLTSFNAISQWLPTEQSQQNNKAALAKAYQAGQLDPFLAVTGQAFELNPNQQPLNLTTWLQSPLGKAYQPQWFDINGQYFSVIKLQGITDKNKVKKALEGQSSVLFVDKAGSVSEQLSHFRINLFKLLGFSLLAAALLLAGVYGLKKALFIVAIPLISVLFALSASALIQPELTVFNALACVLIIALGLDYAVFYADHGIALKISFATFVSALSSILVFAMLALSGTPAIYNFGLTVFIGIVITYLLAPFAALNQTARFQKVSG
ncbi:hypothetical protein N7931_13525 [Catenovulum sp. 2E275]|uniref:MMPL family transporter n=1 Tax=Catenovulum sp. 2E275 TaxID=2980497 RepID=UPI0021CED024|nr:hypothetical protein [Catenovulum sp. 2E275]MCU4676652.1 hypothetical protein [Catenovulum sp. 2E275]